MAFFKNKSINQLISVQFIHLKSRINKINIYEFFALLGVNTNFVGFFFFLVFGTA